MIYAKTGMERLPDECMECDYMFASGSLYCSAKRGWMVLKTAHSKPDNCPLTEIDETPAHDDRLGNGG